MKTIDGHQDVAGIPRVPPTAPPAVRATKEAVNLPQTLIVLSVAIGLGFRLWTMFGAAGSLNSDTAVVGLMARHMLHGQFQAFYWGQNYGGSQEAAVPAALFALVGSSAFALKVSITFWTAASAILVWRIGRLTVGEPAATIGGLLFWVWAPEAIRLSVVQTGGHWPALTFGLGALLVALRIHHGRAGAGSFLLLGLLAGLSVWASPEAAYVLVPATIFFARTLLRRWRQLPFALVGIVVGALPWLYNNINSGWASVNFQPLPIQNNGYLDHLGRFFNALLPIDLGMRSAAGWFAPPVGQLFTVAAVVAFVVALVRFRPHLRLLLVLCASFPFLFAFNPFAFAIGDGRYGLLLIPPVALLLGSAVANGRWVVARGRAAGVTCRRAVAALGIALVVTTIGLYTMNLNPSTGSDDKDLLTLLATNHVRYAHANYWVAFRTTFETREQVVVDPTFASRYRPYDFVRDHADAPYLFVEGERSSVGFFAYCTQHAIPVTVHRAGVFTMAIPERKVLPEEVPVDWTS